MHRLLRVSAPTDRWNIDHVEFCRAACKQIKIHAKRSVYSLWMVSYFIEYCLLCANHNSNLFKYVHKCTRLPICVQFYLQDHEKNCFADTHTSILFEVHKILKWYEQSHLLFWSKYTRTRTHKHNNPHWSVHFA